MKMRNLFLIAAIVASCGFFVGCDDSSDVETELKKAEKDFDREMDKAGKELEAEIDKM